MAVVDTFTASTGSSTVGSATLTLPVPRAVAAGKSIVLFSERADAPNPAGIAGITDTRGNSWAINDAISQRGTVTEVAIHRCRVTVALQAGDNIVVTWNAVGAGRKIIIAHVVDNLLSPAFDVGSGRTIPAAGANIGPNGLSTSPSGSTSAATTLAADLVFSAVAFNSSGGTFTPDAAYTAGASLVTTSGSSDRALATQYRQLSATGVQTAGGTLATSAGWAMAVAAYKTSSSAAPTVTVRAGLTAVEPGTTVTVTAVGTPASGHSIQSYVWTGPAGLTLVGDMGLNASITYTMPAVIGGTSVTLSVTAIDDTGAASSPATVTDTGANPPERLLIAGSWVPARWGVITAGTGGGGGGGGGGTTAALSLTVTPEPDSIPPRIRIDIADDRPTPATTLTVTRRGPDGHTIPVRTGDGGPQPLSGGQATLYDYEPTYEAGLTIATDVPGGPTVVTELDVHDVWLIHPGIPSRSCQVTVTSLPPGGQATNTGLHKVLGSELPVPISSGARQAPSSVMGLRTYTAAEERALRLLFQDDDVVFLNIPPSKGYGWDPCYVTVGDLTPARTVAYGPAQYREWQLPIQVVGRPGGGTQALRTWNTGADEYASWQAGVDAGITSWSQLAAPPA